MTPSLQPKQNGLALSKKKKREKKVWYKKKKLVFIKKLVCISIYEWSVIDFPSPLKEFHNHSASNSFLVLHFFTGERNPALSEHEAIKLRTHTFRPSQNHFALEQNTTFSTAVHTKSVCLEHRQDKRYKEWNYIHIVLWMVNQYWGKNRCIQLF